MRDQDILEDQQYKLFSLLLVLQWKLFKNLPSGLFSRDEIVQMNLLIIQEQIWRF